MSENGIMEDKLLPDCFFSIDNLKTSAECVFTKSSLESVMDEYECKIIRKAYEAYPSTRKLAEALKISQSTASRLIKKHLH